MSIILLIIYILLTIFFIRTLVRCFKRQAKWWILIVSEIIAIAISAFLCSYFDNLPGSGFMPGFTYLGEVLFSYGAAILFSVIFAVSVISKTIIFLLEKKKQGKNYFPGIYLTISIILFIFGTIFLIVDLKNDLNVKKVEATIVSYVDNEYGYARPVVRYSVDGVTYEAMIEVFTKEIKNSGLNDTVSVHYDKSDPSQFGYLSYYENLYVPCFGISIILFFLSRKSRRVK